MFTFIHLLLAWRTVRCLCPCPRPLATSWWVSPPEPLGKGPSSPPLAHHRIRIHLGLISKQKSRVADPDPHFFQLLDPDPGVKMCT
jgi:hypothetical protein